MLDPRKHEDQDRSDLFIDTIMLSGGSSGIHVHEGFELGATLAGRGILAYKETQVEIEPGDAYFLDSSFPHAHDPGLGGFINVLSISISRASIESLAPTDRLMDLIRPFYLTDSGTIPPILKNAGEVTKNMTSALAAFESSDPYGYFAAWAHVINAVISINREISRSINPETNPLDRRKTVVLNTAVDFIRKNYLTDMSLRDIAEHCCVSVSGLSEIFKSRMRISPIKFRNRLRINWGIMLLKTTDYTIERISYDCGFNDVSSFRKMFAAMALRSPHEIRSGQYDERQDMRGYS